MSPFLVVAPSIIFTKEKFINMHLLNAREPFSATVRDYCRFGKTLIFSEAAYSRSDFWTTVFWIAN